MENTTFRLTFNLPAQKFYFDGDTISGVRIRILDGKIAFKAASNPRADDYVGFVARPRGGKEVRIDGELAGEMLDLLMQEASIAQPFFLLTKERNDWLTIQHFAEDVAPPKFTPHVRVWLPREKVTRDNEARAVLNDELSEMLGDFVTVVRVAKQMVTEYDQARKIGRPPREIVEARETLLAFERLATEVIPSRNVIENIEPIHQVVDILTTYVRDHTEIPVEPKVARKPVNVKPDIRPVHSMNDELVPNFILVDEPPMKRGRGRPRKVDITRNMQASEMVVVA